MLTLNKIKSHLNLDTEYTTDDELLISYWNAASEGVEKYLNDPTSDSSLSDDELDSIDARKDIMILMLVAEMFENRELNINSNLKQSNVYDLLASPMVRYSSFG